MDNYQNLRHSSNNFVVYNSTSSFLRAGEPRIASKSPKNRVGFKPDFPDRLEPKNPVAPQKPSQPGHVMHRKRFFDSRIIPPTRLARSRSSSQNLSKSRSGSQLLTKRSTKYTVSVNEFSKTSRSSLNQLKTLKLSQKPKNHFSQNFGSKMVSNPVKKPEISFQATLGRSGIRTQLPESISVKRISESGFGGKLGSEGLKPRPSIISIKQRMPKTVITIHQQWPNKEKPENRQSPKFADLTENERFGGSRAVEMFSEASPQSPRSGGGLGVAILHPKIEKFDRKENDNFEKNQVSQHYAGARGATGWQLRRSASTQELMYSQSSVSLNKNQQIQNKPKIEEKARKRQPRHSKSIRFPQPAQDYFQMAAPSTTKAQKTEKIMFDSFSKIHPKNTFFGKQIHQNDHERLSTDDYYDDSAPKPNQYYSYNEVVNSTFGGDPAPKGPSKPLNNPHQASNHSHSGRDRSAADRVSSEAYQQADVAGVEETDLDVIPDNKKGTQNGYKVRLSEVASRGGQKVHKTSKSINYVKSGQKVEIWDDGGLKGFGGGNGSSGTESSNKSGHVDDYYLHYKEIREKYDFGKIRVGDENDGYEEYPIQIQRSKMVQNGGSKTSRNLKNRVFSTELEDDLGDDFFIVSDSPPLKLIPEPTRINSKLILEPEFEKMTKNSTTPTVSQPTQNMMSTVPEKTTPPSSNLLSTNQSPEEQPSRINIDENYSSGEEQFSTLHKLKNQIEANEGPQQSKKDHGGNWSEEDYLEYLIEREKMEKAAQKFKKVLKKLLNSKNFDLEEDRRRLAEFCRLGSGVGGLGVEMGGGSGRSGGVWPKKDFGGFEMRKGSGNGNYADRDVFEGESGSEEGDSALNLDFSDENQLVMKKIPNPGFIEPADHLKPDENTFDGHEYPRIPNNFTNEPVDHRNPLRTKDTKNSQNRVLFGNQLDSRQNQAPLTQSRALPIEEDTPGFRKSGYADLSEKAKNKQLLLSKDTPDQACSTSKQRSIASECKLISCSSRDEKSLFKENPKISQKIEKSNDLRALEPTEKFAAVRNSRKSNSQHEKVQKSRKSPKHPRSRKEGVVEDRGFYAKTFPNTLGRSLEFRVGNPQKIRSGLKKSAQKRKMKNRVSRDRSNSKDDRGQLKLLEYSKEKLEKVRIRLSQLQKVREIYDQNTDLEENGARDGGGNYANQTNLHQRSAQMIQNGGSGDGKKNAKNQFLSSIDGEINSIHNKIDSIMLMLRNQGLQKSTNDEKMVNNGNLPKSLKTQKNEFDDNVYGLKVVPDQQTTSAVKFVLDNKLESMEIERKSPKRSPSPIKFFYKEDGTDPANTPIAGNTTQIEEAPRTTEASESPKQLKPSKIDSRRHKKFKSMQTSELLKKSQIVRKRGARKASKQSIKAKNDDFNKKLTRAKKLVKSRSKRTASLQANQAAKLKQNASNAPSQHPRIDQNEANSTKKSKRPKYHQSSHYKLSQQGQGSFTTRLHRRNKRESSLTTINVSLNNLTSMSSATTHKLRKRIIGRMGGEGGHSEYLSVYNTHLHHPGPLYSKRGSSAGLNPQIAQNGPMSHRATTSASEQPEMISKGLEDAPESPTEEYFSKIGQKSQNHKKYYKFGERRRTVNLNPSAGPGELYEHLEAGPQTTRSSKGGTGFHHGKNFKKRNGGEFGQKKAIKYRKVIDGGSQDGSEAELKPRSYSPSSVMSEDSVSKLGRFYLQEDPGEQKKHRMPHNSEADLVQISSAWRNHQNQQKTNFSKNRQNRGNSRHQRHKESPSPEHTQPLHQEDQSNPQESLSEHEIMLDIVRKYKLSQQDKTPETILMGPNNHREKVLRTSSLLQTLKNEKEALILKKREREEMEGCTFQPAINQYSKSIANRNKASFEQRQQEWLKEKLERVNSQKRRRDRRQDKQCTFRPQLISSSMSKSIKRQEGSIGPNLAALGALGAGSVLSRSRERLEQYKRKQLRVQLARSRGTEEGSGRSGVSKGGAVLRDGRVYRSNLVVSGTGEVEKDFMRRSGSGDRYLVSLPMTRSQTSRAGSLGRGGGVRVRLEEVVAEAAKGGTSMKKGRGIGDSLVEREGSKTDRQHLK